MCKYSCPTLFGAILQTSFPRMVSIRSSTRLLGLADPHVPDASSAYIASDPLADVGNHCVYSYHSHKALQMMNKYRVGRIDGDWVNFTPPIRGGIFRDTREAAQDGPDDEDSEDDGSSWSSRLESTNSSTTSINSITSEDVCSSVMSNSRSNKGLDLYFSSVHQDRARERKIRVSNAQSDDHQRLSPHDYTSSAIQKAINDDVRDYPSLDAETQSAITFKYQALHQRVKDEGFYECHYIEYGKEIIRYTLLFSLFFTSLRAEWYLTSACFLGLFWVSSFIPSNNSQHADPSTASNHVHGA